MANKKANTHSQQLASPHQLWDIADFADRLETCIGYIDPLMNMAVERVVDDGVGGDQYFQGNMLALLDAMRTQVFVMEVLFEELQCVAIAARKVEAQKTIPQEVAHG